MSVSPNLTKRVIALTLCGFAFLASACNTIEGVGEDLESAGDKAEEVTKKN